MPQFEYVTFMSQLFWLFFFFVFFYSFILKYILPRLSAGLKVRTKYFEAYNKDILDTDIEEKNTWNAYENLFINYFSVSKDSLDKRNQKMNAFLSSVEETKYSNFSDAYKTWLSSQFLLSEKTNVSKKTNKEITWRCFF